MTDVKDYSGVVDGTGYKSSMDDPSKLPLALVPPALVEGVAAILGYGAKKYAPNQWMNGMRWTEPFSAVQRHLLAWQKGEDIDADSGLPHLAHAACSLAFLLHYASDLRYAELDDRQFKAG